MKCSKCGSETVNAQARKAKSPIMFGFIIMFTGIGLMFLGFLGAIIGLILGAIIGGIAKALIPTQYETVATCQNCGHTEVLKNEKK